MTQGPGDGSDQWNAQEVVDQMSLLAVENYQLADLDLTT